jgi:hypothetical protein
VVYPEMNPGHTLLAFTVFLSELGYWLLPKPVDFTILLENALNLGAAKTTLASQQPFATVLEEKRNLFHPILSIFSSCLFPAFALWASAAQLAKTDY